MPFRLGLAVLNSMTPGVRSTAPATQNSAVAQYPRWYCNSGLACVQPKSAWLYVRCSYAGLSSCRFSSAWCSPVRCSRAFATWSVSVASSRACGSPFTASAWRMSSSLRASVSGRLWVSRDDGMTPIYPRASVRNPGTALDVHRDDPGRAGRLEIARVAAGPLLHAGAASHDRRRRLRWRKRLTVAGNECLGGARL